MKLKILLFLVFIYGVTNAQVVCDYPEGVITSLVITEASFLSEPEAYVEITNMGTEPVQLKEFKLGRLTPWGGLGRTLPIFDLCNDQWDGGRNDYLFLPDRILEPDSTFVITNAFDYGPKHYKMGGGRLGGNERPKRIAIYEVADKLLHMEEPIIEIVYPGDSVTTALNDPEQTVRRGSYEMVFNDPKGGTYYLEHHYIEGDSAVVDQVGGVFDNDGKNFAFKHYDVAGVNGAVGNSILVRKDVISNGNIDFANARGVNLEESEWIPIEIKSYNAWRDVWWTIGNHGNFVLDENTLEPVSGDISVDYAAKTITVPWGTRRLDEIMRHMKRKPGVAWEYNLNGLTEDSLYRSARNGDKLTVFVVGNSLTQATFDIVVQNPTADANIVVPIDHFEPAGLWNETGLITTRAQNGILSWPRVTKNESGIDTITGSGFGLPFDLRTDSLLKYLEKPANASWEFVWVDGIERPDLKNGDKLKVISQSGQEKEYFIQAQTHFPNQNANLASITWPDIPLMYRDFMGWKGDTLPNFSAGTSSYRLEVPFDVEGIPALIAKTEHVNASVKTTRAKSLTGTVEERTITFEVTAEDDTVKKIYTIELVKEKFSDKVEPFRADPIYSEFVNTYPYGNAYLEVYNPGNQPIDLRDYMFSMLVTTDLYKPITQNFTWENRYTNYIPGLKYVDKDTWKLTPRILELDPNIDPIIQGGETFVMATVKTQNYPEMEIPPYDVQFFNEKRPGHPNPWNENTLIWSTMGAPIPPNGNMKNAFFMYKILDHAKDSIKMGLKPNTDPNDFEVIDVWGMKDGGYWIVGGYVMGKAECLNIFIRKPHISLGNPVLEGSFGTNSDDCEWERIQPDDVFNYIPKPERYSKALGSLNSHFMIAPTYYRSTVTSSVYKVSDGYGTEMEGGFPKEHIMGVRTGTTVADFLSNINKDDEGQSLMVKSADDSALTPDALVSMNDKLVVVSADSVNTTFYRLDVTEQGLSSDAVLTSARWTIDVEVSPKSAGETTSDGVGSVSGFDYGTTIKAITDNVNVPAGATLTIVDGNGNYVPFTTLNFDTAYVSATVSPDVYLDVVAEDGQTRIVYQLQPSTAGNDAFILSDVYSVSQNSNLIQYVPRGTNFQAFLANITPSLGASLKLVDKMGFERTQGNIREDDKVTVTSSNGLVTRVYFISFLATEAIPSTTYLAYVLSNVYAVDQVDYTITGPTATTLLSDFYARITASMGATAVVVDADGNEKTTGDLDDGDMLRVSSADGKIVVRYELKLDLTSVDLTGVSQIEIYPNPSSGMLNINGINAGTQIQLFTMEGKILKDFKAQSSTALISLETIPSGLFLIIISDKNQTLGRFKAIKK